VKLEKFCQEELNLRNKEHSLRFLRPIKENQGLYLNENNQAYLNFSSNDYLGLRNNPAVILAAKEFVDLFGSGSGASRLVSGNSQAFTLLEKKIATLKKTEDSLVFSSGYACNVGVIQALTNKGDLIIGDKWNHASIIDGGRLSEATFRTYPHLDLQYLETFLKEKRKDYREVLIVTDAVFSMDGDLADLKSLCRIKEDFDCWLMVDEAHSTGVIGKNGRGLVDSLELNTDVDIIMGTLSKAIGSQGGFIAGSKSLIEYCVNKARSFIYSTGLNPAACGAACKAIELIQNEKIHLESLNRNKEYFESLTNLKSPSPIYPIILGESANALATAEKFRKAHIFVQAIRPPTVPEGSARLRITLSAAHTKADIEKIAQIIKTI
jgi:8-amino-7-oxononanoate synthase